MGDGLERLVDSLLYEGYALYPYTPGATKNATPTPFGIVYPPAYAQTLGSTYAHLELRCVLQAPPDAVLSAEARFLAAAGVRHQADAHRVPLSGVMAGSPMPAGTSRVSLARARSKKRELSCTVR